LRQRIAISAFASCDDGIEAVYGGTPTKAKSKFCDDGSGAVYWDKSDIQVM
jgi:hypothetical protein